MASILLAFNVYQQHLMIVNTTQIKRTGKNGIIRIDVLPQDTCKRLFCVAKVVFVGDMNKKSAKKTLILRPGKQKHGY